MCPLAFRYVMALASKHGIRKRSPNGRHTVGYNLGPLERKSDESEVGM